MPTEFPHNTTRHIIMKFQTWHEEKISQASTVKKLTYWQETEDKVTVDARNNGAMSLKF